MKLFICYSLLILGIIEICYGTFLGGMMVNNRGYYFSQALNLHPEKHHIMHEYFNIFRGNWGIVTIFGITNIIISIISFKSYLSKSKISQNKICFTLLILVVIEMFFGTYMGGMMITAEEASFARALELYPYKYQIMKESLDIFRDDWNIVSIFGIANIIITVLIFKSKSLISQNRTE